MRDLDAISIIGFFIGVDSLLFAFYLLTKPETPKTTYVVLGIIAISGFALLNYKSTKSIDAKFLKIDFEQAKLDVEAIARLRKETEDKAAELSSELDGLRREFQAESEATKAMGNELEERLAIVQELQKQLESTTEFHSLMVKVLGDDMEAFRDLSARTSNSFGEWAELAKKVLKLVISERNGADLIHGQIVWPSSIQPSQLSKVEILRIYEKDRKDVLPKTLNGLCHFVSNESSLEEREKLEVLLYIAEKDSNISVVEFAGSEFKKLAGIDLLCLEVDRMREWFDTGKTKSRWIRAKEN